MARRLSTMPTSKYKPPTRFYCLPIGVLLVILGIGILVASPHIVTVVKKTSLSLAPDSKVFHIWRKNQVPNYLEIYLLNWTNPLDIHNSSAPKPRFEQVGPFRFQETKEKFNITWNANGTVSYRQIKRWHFDEKTSCCSLSENVTTINTIYVATISKAREWSFFAKRTMDVGLSIAPHQLHVTKNVSELLFIGYPDPILEIGKTLPFLSSLPPIERFGLYYGKNDSSKPDGLINMSLNPENYGEVVNWNTRPNTLFAPPECSQVRGSAGELYPPGPRARGGRINVFSTDMCRHIPLEYEGDVEVHGITGYKYTLGDRMLDNGTLFKENSCFCNGECLPSGAVNVSACRHGSPSFVSLPHFNRGDPYYTSAVDGLNPDKEKHDFYVILEPNTGLVLSVAIRIQMNLLLKPVSHVTLMEDIPPVLVYPVSWFEQKITITEDVATQLNLLFALPAIIQGVSIAIIIIGALLTCFAAYKPLAYKFCQNYKTPKGASYVYRAGEEVPLKARYKN